ncbi:MAG: DMT family transporter [Sporomusaceae bacterium]|jgi:transporter family-2 protein|nr:DMT family transporter [Sporomusaceae bacterium]
MFKLISAGLLPFAMALASGIIMAVQGSVNTALGKNTGVLEASFIVHLVGTVSAFLLIFVFKLGSGDVLAFSAAPWYTWLGGVLGVAIVYLVAASIPGIGMANATTAIIVGQVATACLIDHFGAVGLERRPFGYEQLIGLALLAIGAKFLLK